MADKISVRMFRRPLIGIIILSLCFTAAQASAREKSAKEKAREVAARKKLIAKAKEELNNTVWKIELTQMAANGKKKTEPDTINFENNKILSEKLQSEGFSATNYTVRLKGAQNEVTIWETMQTSEDKGVAFWRGEVKEGAMRGVLSWHISDKSKKDYTFKSEKKEIIAPSVKAAPVVEKALAAKTAPTIEKKTAEETVSAKEAAEGIVKEVAEEPAVVPEPAEKKVEEKAKPKKKGWLWGRK